MSEKIKDLAESIKSKLSFDDYKPATQKKTDFGNAGIMSNDVKKVKRTFYIQEDIANQLDALYAKKITDRKKVDKSDIVSQALTNLFEDPECEVKTF